MKSFAQTSRQTKRMHPMVSSAGRGMPGASPYTLYDRFTDTNGTALTSHTSDARDPQGRILPVSVNWANAFDNGSPTVDIQSNKVRYAGNAGSYSVDVIDTGNTDGIFEVDFTIDNAASDAGITVRTTNVNNRIVVFFNNDVNKLQIYEADGGGAVKQAESSFVFSTGALTIKVALEGNTITGWANGSAEVTYTGLTANPTTTTHGVHFVAGANGVTINADNFRVEPQ